MASKVLCVLLVLLVIYEIQVEAKVACYPKLCDYVNCKRFEALCIYPGAKRIKNGNICGCCDKCIIVKRKGQPCFVALEKFGIIDTVCESGYSCGIMSLKCE